MHTQMKSRKTLFRKAISFLIVLCMMCGFIVPLASVTAYAAAPASYTTITADSTASVSITSSGSAKYFKFVPTASGTYKFYSTQKCKLRRTKNMQNRKSNFLESFFQKSLAF